VQGGGTGTGGQTLSRKGDLSDGMPHAYELTLRWGPGVHSPTTSARVPRLREPETRFDRSAEKSPSFGTVNSAARPTTEAGRWQENSEPPKCRPGRRPRVRPDRKRCGPASGRTRRAATWMAVGCSSVPACSGQYVTSRTWQGATGTSADHRLSTARLSRGSRLSHAASVSRNHVVAGTSAPSRRR
jgi:hypothetical protein